MSGWVWGGLLAMTVGLALEARFLRRLTRRPRCPDVPWGVKDCLLSVVATLLLSGLVLAFAAAPWVRTMSAPDTGAGGEETEAPPIRGRTVLALQAGLMAALAAPVAWVAFVRHRYGRARAGLRSPASRWAWAAPLAILPVCAAAEWGAVRLLAALGMAPPVQVFGELLRATRASVDAGTQGAWDIVALVVLAAGVAPVAEEFLFRFFLFETLRRYLGRNWSWAATSLLFGVVHLETRLVIPDAAWGSTTGAAEAAVIILLEHVIPGLVTVVLPICLFGALLQWITLSSRSLAPAVLTHAVNNALYVSLYLSGWDPGSLAGGG